MRPVAAGTTINGLRFGFPYSFHVSNFHKNAKLANVKFHLLNLLYVHFVASQAWCLARHLPLLLGNRVPKEDEKLQLFLLLLEIVELVFSPVISREQASYLQAIIEEHHVRFVEQYPAASIIPKMHYIIHYPRTIVR